VAEACDDGNVVDGDGCQADCALPRCGDGIEDPGEDCDDGAGNSETGACRLTCQDATCGDGRVWAGVEACDQGEDNGDDAGCTAACEDASCGDGLVWAGVEACDDGNQVEGDGCQADCALPRCGDDVVDPGEVCDDGDNQPGDGCAFDCSSTEVCGNGLIDYFVGEACDDANLTPYDGCTRCQADAPPLWTEHLQAPGGRAGTAMAYDVHRQVVVLYGGDANQRLSDTWEWDGRAWLRRFPVHSPGRLAFHAMAYDPVRRRTVLVGGLGVAGASGRTWEWDGVDWLEQSGDDPERPGAVYGHAIAFHPQTSQMVLAGGVGRDRKTYIREGTLWLERGELPEELEFPAMATVPSTGNVILAGGKPWSRGPREGPSLERRQLAVAPDLPIGVTQHVLVADGLTGRLHLVGGMDPEQPEQARHWIGDGASWEEAAPLPTPVRQAAAAWDLARGALVHFGGTSNATGYSAATTRWTPDDGISVVPAPASPGAVQFATMAYDSWRGELVLVGGTTLAGPVTETWIWDGSSWATRGPAPGPRLEAAMAFDESAGVMVLFGGRDGGSTLTDTLMWDGSSWADGGSSDGRYGASMAYEPSLGKVVRSGGNAGGPVAFETLAYDVAAATWLDLGLPSPPSYGGPMITTPAGVLLYQANVLWLLSPGSGWTPYHSGPPAPSGVVGMAFDPLLGRPVVFGDPDTWEFDGSRWTFPETRNAPDVRRSHVLAHDPRSHRTFVVGGSQNGGVYFDETWSYRWEGEREEVCLAGFDGDGDGAVGCDDPDCWTFCRPACPPDQACPADAPVCGDAACDPLETPRLCPGDCGPPQPACGDGHVDAGELECLYDQMAPGG
jgi:cysteine-rich repeat protein